MTPLAVPRINDFIRWVELGDGSVIAYNMRSAQYLEVKAPLTVRIWLTLDGERSASQVLDQVNAERPPGFPALTPAALDRLLEGLARMDIVSMASGTPA